MPTLLPLRAEPPPPVIESQGASAQGAADLVEAVRWRYHLRYLHPHAAQDEVMIVLSLNVATPDEAVADDAPPRDDFRLAARLVYSDDGEFVVALRLTREPDDALPAGRWPTADVRLPSEPPVDLGDGVGDGTERTYAFDPPVPGEGWAGVGLTWHGLGVASAQNARASLAVVRNRGLVDPATGGDAVLRTATVQAWGPVAPLNRWPDDIDISGLGDSVGAALAAVLGEFRSGQRVSIEAFYGYRVQPPAERPSSDPDALPLAYLPVGQYGDLAIDASTAARIAETLDEWRRAYDPPARGAQWRLSLVLYAQFVAPEPLLDLRSLVYRA